MTSKDIIKYKRLGFDNLKYEQAQKNAILERIAKFKDGRLYLEIGGKFLWDPHAARVLPGFDPEAKRHIFADLISDTDIIFCINAQDLINNRELLSQHTEYLEVVLKMLFGINQKLGIKPFISINLVKDEQDVQRILYAINRLHKAGFKTFIRNFIQGYPNDTNKILSVAGFGRDDYVPVTKKLVLVTGAASNSGKMSTCMGQIFMEQKRGIASGYAKYETFPIWNLPLEHPVNLAYEAATADIGDFNVIDEYHKKNYGQIAVNYNRDEEAFRLLNRLIREFMDKHNFMRNYKSPTDMGINMAGFAVTNDEVVSVASYQEIVRRASWYLDLQQVGATETCLTLAEKAKQYIMSKKYDIDLELT